MALTKVASTMLATAPPTITEWVAYTPTFVGFGTPSSSNFFSRRVGDSLEIRGDVTSGIATGVPATFTLGFNGTNANVTSDNSGKLPNLQYIGTGCFGHATTGSMTVLASANVGYCNLGVQNAVAAGRDAALGTDLLIEGLSLAITACVPINGWTTNN